MNIGKVRDISIESDSTLTQILNFSEVGYMATYGVKEFGLTSLNTVSLI